NNDSLFYIIALTILLFIIRFILIFFANTIGTMPYLKPDIIFYSLLTIFGVVATWIYVKYIEKTSFEDLGWKKENVGKNIIFGLLSFIPLILMFPLIIILVNIQVSFIITLDKLILGIGFGLILGGFYEETMFRGVIQNHVNSLTDEKKSVLLTAVIFTATHIGYLPFDGFGIIYVFVFVMGLLLSYLRLKFNQLACFILHGGIVFILVIFVNIPSPFFNF
ncbi:MAG: CPBP family intramembrane glutamic endopeptidase, partial [Promethearchaeota archaeon]